MTEQYSNEICRLTQDGKIPFYTLDFNTSDKVPKNFQNLDWMELSKELKEKEILKRIKYVTVDENVLVMCYDIFYKGLGIRENIARFNFRTGEIKAMRLNDRLDHRFPCVSNLLGFSDNRLITYAPAVLVLERKKRTGNSILKNIVLNEMDNLVLFFHHLKR